MFISSSIAALLLASAPSAVGQGSPTTEPLVTATLVQFPSAIIGETRPVIVQVPEGASPGGFDVVVVLDGETHGFHIAGLVDFPSHEYVDQMPKSIVSVINTDRLRDTTPTPTPSHPNAGGGRSFTHFLADELLPWIDSNYPTSGRRTLVGHSGSGLAAMYAPIETPHAYGSIVSVGPSLDWDDSIRLSDLEQAWGMQPSVDIQSALSTYRRKDSMVALADLLRSVAPRGLDSRIKLYKGETHNSMVHRAVHEGLIELNE